LRKSSPAELHPVAHLDLPGGDLAHLDERGYAVPLAGNEAEGRKRNEKEEESRAQQETIVIEEVP
jgi:hypothetical protein